METRKRKNQDLVFIIENDIVVPNIKKEPIDNVETKPQPNIMETINIEDKHQIAIIENNIDIISEKEPNDIIIGSEQQNLVDNVIIADIKEELDIEETLENVYDNQIDIDENCITANIKQEPSDIDVQNIEVNPNESIESVTVNIKEDKKELITDKKTCNVVLDQSDNDFVTVKIEPDSSKEKNPSEDITDFSTDDVVVTVETLVLIDCPHCPKKFLTEEIFQTHYKQEHLLNCSQCKKTYVITYSRSGDAELCMNCRMYPLTNKKVVKERCKVCGFECNASFMTRHFEVVHKIYDKNKCASLCERVVAEPIECYGYY